MITNAGKASLLGKLESCAVDSRPSLTTSSRQFCHESHSCIFCSRLSHFHRQHEILTTARTREHLLLLSHHISQVDYCKHPSITLAAMTEVSESPDRDRRRDELSAAIMDGFETVGWTWSDNELMEKVTAIVTAERPHWAGEKAAKLARTFGESQIVPREGALLCLSRRLRTELQQAMEESGSHIYDTIRILFANPRFDKELRGIVGSDEIFPLPYAPKQNAWFRTGAGLAKKLQVVSKSCLKTTEFNVVLWIVSRAAQSVLGQLSTLACEKYYARDTGRPHLEETLIYRSLELAAQPARAQLREHLTRLPSELRTIIFGQLVDDWDKRWLLRFFESFTGWTKPVVEMLSDIEYIPEFFSFDYRYDPQRQNFRYVNTQEVEERFGGEIKEAVMKALRVELDVKFPNRDKDHLSLPPALVVCARHIRHLDLRIEITMPYVSDVYYPSALYTVQDNLPILTTILPSLKTIELVIFDDDPIPNFLRVGSRAVQWIVKGRSPLEQGTTNRRDELTELVRRLARSGIKEKWVRSQYAWQASTYDDRVPASEEKTMSIASFMDAAFSWSGQPWSGVAFEVTSVGDDLGDVLCGVEKRQKREGPWR